LNTQKEQAVASTASASFFKTRLANRQEIAERTMGFRFERPEGWTFQAGQSIDLTILDSAETDAKGNIVPFRLPVRHPKGN
jgi:NAD(P)H-flavin reductase